MAPAIDLCFPLTKCHHATGPANESNIQWVQYQGPLLHVFLQGDVLPQSPLTLKLVERDTTREILQIGDYIDMAVGTQRAAERSGHVGDVPTSSLEIIGMAKDAVLALRYRLPDGQVRRLQLRLEDKLRCQQLLAIFRRRGLRLQLDPSRASTAVSRMSTAQSQFRPQSTGVDSAASGLQNPPTYATFRLPDTGSRHPEVRPMSHPIRSTNGPTPTSHLFTGALSGSIDGQRFSVIDNANFEQSLQAQSSSERLNSRDQSPWSTDPALVRPTTAASTTLPSSSGVDTLEHEIPPRRQLPFKRPDSRKADSASKKSRADISALPFSKPQRAEFTPKWPVPDSVQPGRADRAESKSHTNRAGVEAQVPSVHAQQREAGNVLIAQVMERGTSRIDSLADAPHEIESPPGTARLPSASSRSNAAQLATTAANAQLQSSFVDIENSVQTNSESSLDGYAAQSTADRQAALEKFMMDNLSNPSFATLCEDMEHSWRKSALGL